MPATIVFANGSKRMAHNLDDLSFRWYERKVATVEEAKVLQTEGITIRDCTKPRNLPEAQKWRRELELQLTTLKSSLAMFQSRGVSRNAVMGLIEARDEVRRQLAVIRDYHARLAVKETRHGFVKDPIALADALKDAHLEIAYLRKILRKSFNCEPDYKYIDPPK